MKSYHKFQLSIFISFLISSNLLFNLVLCLINLIICFIKRKNDDEFGKDIVFKMIKNNNNNNNSYNNNILCYFRYYLFSSLSDIEESFIRYHIMVICIINIYCCKFK